MDSFKNFLSKARGSAYLAYQLMGQQGVPYRPLAELEARRDRNVRAIVDYAARTVPYYRDLFQTQGLDPRQFRTADDLKELPIIDKKTVLADPERFVSESAEGRSAFRMRTSGTSGIPLPIYQSNNYLLENAAQGERDQDVFNRVLGPGVPQRQLSITYPTNAISVVRPKLRELAFIPKRGNLKVVSLFEPLDEIIAQINHYKPNIISSYGSFFELLFKTVKARGLDLHLPRIVFYISDHLAPEVQRFIEEDFGIEVLSRYSAIEAMRIGFICQAHSGFHLHMDLTHLRVADQNGKDEPLGTTGDIVISNLTNRGTVLLNYRLGDQGQLGQQPCTCGRTLPLLALITGRSDDSVILPNGNYLHSTAIWQVIREKAEFLQYQIVQQTPEHFDLRLTTVDEASFERIQADLLDKIRPLLGEGVSLTASYVDPNTPFGSTKRRRLVPYVHRATADPSAPTA